MGGVDGDAGSGGEAYSRGRIDKRQAIVRAAFDVFARDGYAQASVDAIAAAAGVAKPTIYNHFGAKENLFRVVMADVGRRATAATLEVLGAFPAEPDDLRAELTQLGRRLTTCFADPVSTSLRRLLHAEIVRFPDLLDEVRAGAATPVIDALAGPLARLATAGHLQLSDPIRASNQFIALIGDELPALTALGTRPAPPEQIDAVVTAGVDTFLRAFGTADNSPALGDPDPHAATTSHPT
ncbi:TetR/AcrR family transcriptional regulator [Frankia sp. CNm7]|uniref:TetR/AcrR family transcriptional regulator n=1 Tax=Frankia nepalensis TaxID=1836974 RepID=A0A937RBB8_9ACTN|nr:TetR/AcrR family transcriptional regulator [Frankia nepalensis]MBL7495304.1 TetR/AcrR family transcriptional regulator [Frankia nepalensis]MBL7515917.1 TetR/AcrR family transcriptional regulator [Frankia nepalensis]MBL7519384.1 TetR/AcrR family transcriptional regulator [Frankia nepalensis]MBL7628998.1 TetR/AcrR family transcriptional regulator [Frankia nepalensis]